ncbi:decarboxylating 6-phosphogluconate dehydrogenase [Enterococcus sp. BWB1-3]|uniref:phosphogluconate dehydrogenase (NAD(+)-dependent, decarboxylating) n=1 Tax=Enterococcus sp. BWB1-3 TaxID=2787713 RepID=UPI001920FD30|nr:decarboxylating 6-phosphogluconate dehydrogenase [Enterococcus sp. BWB1-3]MBL1228040.1 decarboxylating 6-phosphogluconate dehydrogenase [Enterococcus sp. BWB1-3]
MKIGIIGLGKMGMNLAFNLKDHGYDVRGVDLSEAVVKEAEKNNITVYEKSEALIGSFEQERKIIWLMLPSGEPTEAVLNELLPQLGRYDIVIEGGNSNYKDSIRRAEKFAEEGVYYLDCGTSGGISGARNDACLMVGGAVEAVYAMEQVFKDVTVENGFLYAGKSGSGHFLKMIHNGIEYGMMQAIGEGFQLVEASDYDFDLAKVAKVWNHGSVIRSWLMELAQNAFEESPGLENYRGIVSASGEAKWTVETALDMEVPVPVIALSLMMRNRSQEEDSFSGKVVSALRNGFGGHAVVEK